ncbi:hypothetical protein IWX90DRAFT_419241 [Phyllosticta citrichinensis]|uniref:Uncharacterized protein n=1 Tax=Phyllosticta citrichinensis TaxID=1130410 RepID=A0ABR1XFL0_9PEZI
MELDEGWISGGVSAQGAHRPVSTAAARHSSSNQNQSGNLNAPAALSTPANQTQSSGWNAPTVQRPQPPPIFQVQRPMGIYSSRIRSPAWSSIRTTEERGTRPSGSGRARSKRANNPEMTARVQLRHSNGSQLDWNGTGQTAFLVFRVVCVVHIANAACATAKTLQIVVRESVFHWGGERKEIGLVGKDDGVMVSSSESDGFNKDEFDAALSGPRA